MCRGRAACGKKTRSGRGKTGTVPRTIRLSRALACASIIRPPPPHPVYPAGRRDRRIVSAARVMILCLFGREEPMGQYRRHVFVCTHGEYCPFDGSAEVHRLLKEAVSARGLKTEIRVNKAGCFNQCGNGPMVVIYPDDVWYGQVTPEKVSRIVEEHLAGGR